MSKKLSLGWGVMCDPISVQLKEQGFNLEDKQLAYFDRIKQALNTLLFNGLTTDSQHRAINKRCHDYIVKQVQKWYNTQQERGAENE